MIMYKTGVAVLGILKVEVERETKSFVILKGGRRVGKNAEEYQYHHTFEDAKRFLVEQEENNIKNLKAMLFFQEEQIRKSQLRLDIYSELVEFS